MGCIKYFDLVLQDVIRPECLRIFIDTKEPVLAKKKANINCTGALWFTTFLIVLNEVKCKSLKVKVQRPTESKMQAVKSRNKLADHDE